MNSFFKFFSIFAVLAATLLGATPAAAGITPEGTDGAQCGGMSGDQLAACLNANKKLICDALATCNQGPRTKVTSSIVYQCTGPEQSLPAQAPNHKDCVCGNPAYAPMMVNGIIPKGSRTSKSTDTNGVETTTTHTQYTGLVICKLRDEVTPEQVNQVIQITYQHFEEETQKAFVEAMSARVAADNAQLTADEAKAKAEQAWNRLGDVLRELQGLDKRVTDLEHGVQDLQLTMPGLTIGAGPAGSSAVGGVSWMSMCVDGSLRFYHDADPQHAFDFGGQFCYSPESWNENTYTARTESGSLFVWSLNPTYSLMLAGNPRFRLRLGAIGTQSFRNEDRVSIIPQGRVENAKFGSFSFGPSVGLDIPLGDSDFSLRPTLAVPYTWHGGDNKQGFGVAGSLTLGFSFDGPEPTPAK